MEHVDCLSFVMSLQRAGTHDGAVVNITRGLVSNLKDADPGKQQRRLKEIPDIVASGRAKIETENHQIDYSPQPLAAVHAVFARWLGDEYDSGTLDAVLAVAAAERLPGDPAWLLVISGSGNAKTETVQATSAIKIAHIVSTIASEGALPSASSKKSRTKGATGGLLRKIGARGLLIIKDFTSIISADRDLRTAVLAALREVHDGRWDRNVGTDGGQTLSWAGRLVVIGAWTTAWDQAHQVISSCGDRFVLIRSVPTFPQRSPPSLLTTAACGGLKSAPDC
jgi:hypothetical protein